MFSTLSSALLGVLVAAAPDTAPQLLTDIASAPAWQGTIEMTAESALLDDAAATTYTVRSLAAPADSLVGAEYVVTWPDDHIEAYAQGALYSRAGSGLMTELQPDSATLALRHGRPIAADAALASMVPQSLAAGLLRELRSGESCVVSASPSEVVIGSVATSRTVSVALPSAPFDGHATVTLSTGGNYPSVTTYHWLPDAQTDSSPITFENLLASHRDLFTRYNPAYITPQSLIGRPVPSFRLRSLDGSRFEWSREGLGHPALIALLDGPDRIAEARRLAADSIAAAGGSLILAFTANNPDRVEEWLSSQPAFPGERVLLRAADLCRATGARSLPLYIMASPDGTVERVILPGDVSEPSAPNGCYNDKQNNNNNKTTNQDMETVFFQGQPCHTYGNVPSVGETAPCFHLTGADLGQIICTDFPGKKVVLNIFPSLDTEVCARSVRKFNEEAAGIDDVVVVCVSMDLPFAMSRFCTLEGLKNVVPASAFRSPLFGQKYGVLLVDGPLAGLLTRAVIILDENRRVIYRDLVEEITHDPDYEGAVRVLKGE